MRTVKFKVNNIEHEGVFHQWGTKIHTSDGILSEPITQYVITVAIVEDAKGLIYEIEPSNIIFTLPNTVNELIGNDKCNEDYTDILKTILETSYYIALSTDRKYKYNDVSLKVVAGNKCGECYMNDFNCERILCNSKLILIKE